MDRLFILIAIEAEARSTLADPFFAFSRLSAYTGRGEASRGLYRSSRYPLDLALTGVGKANSAFALGALLDPFSGAPKEGRRFLSLGSSGALDGRKLGGLWISGEFVEHDMDASGFGVPRGMTPLEGQGDHVIRSAGGDYLAFLRGALAGAGLGAALARSASGDKFLCDAAEAAGLAASFGAELVDMESAALAKLCAGAEAEYAAVRAVSDNANHESKGTFSEAIGAISETLRLALRAIAKEAWGERP